MAACNGLQSDDNPLCAIDTCTLPWAKRATHAFRFGHGSRAAGYVLLLERHAHNFLERRVGFPCSPRQVRFVQYVCHWRPFAGWEVTPYTRHLPLHVRSHHTARRSMAAAAAAIAYRQLNSNALAQLS